LHARYAIATDGVYAETSDAGLPPPGYSAPAVVRGVITADRLLVDLHADGVEIELVLAGIDPEPPFTELDTHTGCQRLTPAAARSRDWVADAIDAAKGLRHHVYLPRPRHVAGWLPSLRPGSRHVGLLFLTGDTTSLNSRIAAAGICRTDAECAFLSSRWNRHHVAV
jgi:hypothetical protein